jgi:RNA polymerase sigma-70 factor (ECF subfamily)
MGVLDVEASSVTESTGLDPVRRVLVDQIPVLRTLARRLCRTAAESEALVQEVLRRAVRSDDRATVGDRPRGWMVKILHDVHLERCRARHAAPRRAGVSATAPAVVRAWSEVAADELRHAASELPDELRAVYAMFALEGRGYAEIAATLDLPEPSVRSRLARARARLTQRLLAGRGSEAP